MNRTPRTEYWVSNARKFCDFCKCSIADNKPSIQFHENGKKHKENVRKRLSEMSKKATKDAHAAATMEKQIKKMERDAMKAYMKDIEANPDVTSLDIKEKINNIVKPNETKEEPKKDLPPDKPKEKKTKSKWFEAKSEQGYSYYWHTETGESVWEPPKDGYVSIAEQEATPPSSKSGVKAAKVKKEPKELSVREINQQIYGAGKPTTVKKEPSVAESAFEDPVIGPSPRANPYGTWTAVVKEENSYADLELPEVKPTVLHVPDLPPEERQRTFKERKAPVASTECVGEVAFKKRKFGSARNTRQRLGDD